MRPGSIGAAERVPAPARAARAPLRVPVRVPGDRRRLRIGLLGGSFNPAHAGHAHVARTALRALRLDQVWLMVSPGNPLKPVSGMAPFAERLESARRVADGARILASDIEAALGHRRTERTLAVLRRRFPRARFVFVIGADNLWQLPRWGGWRRLAARTPIAVLPRPGWTRRALHGQAASVLRRRRRRPAALLAGPAPGRGGGRAGWSLVPAREDPISATALREAARRGAGGSTLHPPPAEGAGAGARRGGVRGGGATATPVAGRRRREAPAQPAAS